MNAAKQIYERSCDAALGRYERFQDQSRMICTLWVLCWSIHLCSLSVACLFHRLLRVHFHPHPPRCRHSLPYLHPALQQTRQSTLFAYKVNDEALNLIWICTKKVLATLEQKAGTVSGWHHRLPCRFRPLRIHPEHHFGSTFDLQSHVHYHWLHHFPRYSHHSASYSKSSHRP